MKKLRLFSCGMGAPLLGNANSYMTNENDYTSFDDIELDEEETVGSIEKIETVDTEYVEE